MSYAHFYIILAVSGEIIHYCIAPYDNDGVHDAGGVSSLKGREEIAS